METAASLAAGLTRTPARGWLVVLFSRLQGSSVVLISYRCGIFLPFIRQDLQLFPLEDTRSPEEMIAESYASRTSLPSLQVFKA
jgi:hypothetical protein